MATGGEGRRRSAAGSGRSIRLSRRQAIAAGLGGVTGFALGQYVSLARPVSVPEDGDVGRYYWRWSEVDTSTAVPTVDWGQPEAGPKVYPGASDNALPAPPDDGFFAVVNKRRSQREYSDRSMSLDALSALLFAAQGITSVTQGYRAAPSAGALYPIELYAIVGRVAGVQPGVYHYAVPWHSLELVQGGDFRQSLFEASLEQSAIQQAAVVLVLVAVFQRTRWKYKERSYRYILIEAGHIGQNICLAATALGLGACPIGAFTDRALDTLLGVDGDREAAVYELAVGPI